MNESENVFYEVYKDSVSQLVKANLGFDLRVGKTYAVDTKHKILPVELDAYLPKAVFASRLPTQVIIEVNDHLLRDVVKHKLKGGTCPQYIEDKLMEIKSQQGVENLEQLIDLPKESSANTSFREWVVGRIISKFRVAGIPYFVVFSGGSSKHIHVFVELTKELKEFYSNFDLTTASLQPKTKDLRKWGRFSASKFLFVYLVKAAGLSEDLCIKENGLSLENPILDTALFNARGMFPLPGKQRLDKLHPTAIEEAFSLKGKYMYVLNEQLFEELVSLFTPTKQSKSKQEEEVTNLLRLKQYAMVVIKRGCDTLEKGHRYQIPKGYRDEYSGSLYLSLRRDGYAHRVVMDVLTKMLDDSTEAKEILKKTNTRRRNEFETKYIEEVNVDDKLALFSSEEYKLIDEAADDFAEFLQHIKAIKVYRGLSKEIISYSLVFGFEDGSQEEESEDIIEMPVTQLNNINTLLSELVRIYEWMRLEGKINKGSLEELFQESIWGVTHTSNKGVKARLDTFRTNLKYIVSLRFACEGVDKEQVLVYDDILKHIAISIALKLEDWMVERGEYDIESKEFYRMYFKNLHQFADKQELMSMVRVALKGSSKASHKEITNYINTLIYYKRVKTPNKGYVTIYKFTTPVENEINELVRKYLKEDKENIIERINHKKELEEMYYTMHPEVDRGNKQKDISDKQDVYSELAEPDLGFGEQEEAP